MERAKLGCWQRGVGLRRTLITVDAEVEQTHDLTRGCPGDWMRGKLPRKGGRKPGGQLDGRKKWTPE